MNEKVLHGKVAVVTGGSRGIGRAISLRLAAMGALVYINYVSRPDAAEETRRLIESIDGKAEILAFDVSEPEQIQAAFKHIVDTSGRIDILVNNAGITRDGLVARMKESDWDAVLTTNLKGAFLCAKAASKPMMKQRWGRIVNITSVIGFTGNAGQVNYAAAKAGLVGITKSLARELASRNITVNSVAPGYILTDMTDALPLEVQEQLKKEIPLGSLGTPEDVAGAVAYLTSDDGRYLTGQTLHINGGMYM